MEQMSNAVTVIEPREIRQISADEIRQRINLVQEVMREVMIEGVHYGVIPGTKEKSLYKPGAEILCVTFRLAPHYAITRFNLEGGHREYEITTTLEHTPTGQIWGEGVGSCSTLESKYRYRFASRVCPECNAETISKSRQEYGGGWYCSTKKGGCGAKFDADDDSIIDQEAGRTENPDIADQYNTVLKIAKKRSHSDATLTATACSDIFKQTTVDEDEEPSQQAERKTPEHRPAQTSNAKVNQGQINMLMGACKSFSVSEQQLLAYLAEGHNVQSRKDIPHDKFQTVLDWVKAQKPEQRTGK